MDYNRRENECRRQEFSFSEAQLINITPYIIRQYWLRENESYSQAHNFHFHLSSWFVVINKSISSTLPPFFDIIKYRDN